MLTIKDLHVSVDNKAILKGINLTIKAGEVHAIMGPNGSGKSTLSKVLAGRDGYTITRGTIEFMGQDLTELEPCDRAHAGLFLAFQYPVEIPGVSNVQFLKAAVNAVRKAKGEEEISSVDFLKLVREKMALVDMDQDLIYRSLNDGFSGGEKKRNETLQMLMLEPTLAILDETDSGLDIDALQSVAKGVNSLRSQDRSFLMITHYQRLLNHIEPDFIHVLARGEIIKSGDKSLAQELEAKGYGWLLQEQADECE